MNQKVNELIAKIILWTDGSVHIVFKNENNKVVSVSCTKEKLYKILTMPHHYIKEWTKKATPKSSNNIKINTQTKEIEQVNGLTLISIYEDKHIKIIHPVLLEKANVYDDEEPIKFDDYKNKKKFKDQKEHWIQLFLKYTSPKKESIKISREVVIPKEEEYRFLKEVIDTAFVFKPEIQIDEGISLEEMVDRGKQVTLAEYKDEISEDGFVLIKEYASIYNVSVELVKNTIDKDLFKKVIGKGSQIKIDIHEIPDVIRKAIKANKDKFNKAKLSEKIESKQTSINVDLYTNLADQTQEYLLRNSNYSNNIKKYIASIEEAKFYVENGYREIEFLNRSCLIVEIDLDYVHEGKTNRDIIKSNNSPYDHLTDTIFHVHHIGQKEDSPFAIIPEKYHIGNHSVFHQSRSYDVDRSNNFLHQKRALFNEYLDYIKKYGTFDKIPTVKENNNR